MNIYSIYKITNLVNGKIYIGYTGQTVDERYREHLIESRRRPRLELHRAIKKYGIESFTVECVYQSLSKEHILDMETHFIKYYSSHCEDGHGYNMNYGGQGGNIKTAAQRLELSKKMKINNPSKNPETRKKISKGVLSAHRRGVYNSSEKYVKAFEANKQRFADNNPGKNKSPETLEKISLSQKERYLTDPSKWVSGEDHYWYGTRGVFYSQDEQWQKEQRKRSSNLRNNEVHKCPCCDRTIKTNANFYKHLRIKHDYTDEMIQSARVSLSQKSSVP